VQPDGRIVAGGFFQYHGGHWRNFVSRLNADGSFDPTFDPGSGFSDPVRCLLAQNDGRIVVAGDFSIFNNSSCGKVVRLNANGSRDDGFQVNDLQRVYLNAGPFVRYAEDGRLLVSGVYAGQGRDFRGGLAMFTAAQLVSFGDWIGSWSLPADQRGALNVPAGDGVPNLLKFAFGVPPRQSVGAHAPTIAMCEQSDGSGALALVFAKNGKGDGLRFALESSEDLENWHEIPSRTETLAENSDGTLLVRMSEAVGTPTPRRFIRLKVSNGSR
jgi:hypothetical protein